MRLKLDLSKETSFSLLTTFIGKAGHIEDDGSFTRSGEDEIYCSLQIGEASIRLTPEQANRIGAELAAFIPADFATKR